MIQQANSENFESLVQDGFVIVDFYGTTCVPCKLFARCSGSLRLIPLCT